VPEEENVASSLLPVRSTSSILPYDSVEQAPAQSGRSRPGRSGFTSAALVLLFVVVKRLMRLLERHAPELGQPPGSFKLQSARLLHE